MLIHTAVASLAPRQAMRHRKGRQRKAVSLTPPSDFLSGGDREVLASYTAFSYQGNFSDVVCRLMDTLPHQSPASGMGRKRLGRDRAGGGSRTDGGGGLTGIERVRHHDGDHVFYLYVTAELGILCVTDGIPVDQEVFAYLALVEEAVSSAVAPLRRAADAETVRRAASLALVESMNTWTSQVDGGGRASPDPRSSPTPTRSTTPISGDSRRSSASRHSKKTGQCSLERCGCCSAKATHWATDIPPTFECGSDLENARMSRRRLLSRRRMVGGGVSCFVCEGGPR
ncbi:hypothetical protein Esi_0263_0022 [Ectocarpus siliculosus]|uniref:Uncharacterized protein n=1 Tax=Ectocarpus siliculosus TaxID=2880 RepID=D7FU19_ECTSI|nr:hypothetical protein Esi_0263_0022 [Ectocarpus siliculosus]|eukprot:CBJ31546.1 hypothetical protein Esi_0263_0022 [Ectocarpus siliculosus]